MADWTPIELGRPDVASDRDYAQMAIVSIPLTPRPDQMWTAIFNQGPPAGVEYSISIAFPQVSGGAVQFRCGVDDVQKNFDQAKRWVEGTNAEYERSILPELERREQAAKAEAETRKETVEEVQRKLDELS